MINNAALQAGLAAFAKQYLRDARPVPLNNQFDAPKKPVTTEAEAKAHIKDRLDPPWLR